MLGQEPRGIIKKKKKKKFIVACISCKLETGHVLKGEHVHAYA
jgi:hypothetical protein